MSQSLIGSSTRTYSDPNPECAAPIAVWCARARITHGSGPTNARPRGPSAVAVVSGLPSPGGICDPLKHRRFGARDHHSKRLGEASALHRRQLADAGKPRTIQRRAALGETAAIRRMGVAVRRDLRPAVPADGAHHDRARLRQERLDLASPHAARRRRHTHPPRQICGHEIDAAAGGAARTSRGLDLTAATPASLARRRGRRAGSSWSDGSSRTWRSRGAAPWCGAGDTRTSVSFACHNTLNRCKMFVVWLASS